MKFLYDGQARTSHSFDVAQRHGVLPLSSKRIIIIFNQDILFYCDILLMGISHARDKCTRQKSSSDNTKYHIISILARFTHGHRTA